jgi:hypothetical protein
MLHFHLINPLINPFAGIAEFVGFPKMKTLVCPQDPSEPARLGYHGNKFVSIWDNGNRAGVTVDAYMAGIEAMNPSAFVALCDGETPKNCPAKRLAKAVSKSAEYLDDTAIVLARNSGDAKGVRFSAGKVFG